MNASTSLLRPLRQTLRRIPHSAPLQRQPILNRYSSSSASTSATVSSSSSPAPTPLSSSPKPKGPKRPVSSCPAGTVMTGLSILKDQPDPVALPDDQYPDWLWTLLDEPVSASAGGMEGKLPGDLKSGADFRQEKKRLRSVNRANIKGANYLKTT